jgi:hypothetical protein
LNEVCRPTRKCYGRAPSTRRSAHRTSGAATLLRTPQWVHTRCPLGRLKMTSRNLRACARRTQGGDRPTTALRCVSEPGGRSVRGSAIASSWRTMLAPISSLSALESDNEDRLPAELRLARLRSQLAVIRTLADHIEHLARPQDADGLGHQIVEEMARLGCRLLEASLRHGRCIGPTVRAVAEPPMTP